MGLYKFKSTKLTKSCIKLKSNTISFFCSVQFLLRVDNLALLSLFYRYITTAIVLVLCFYFIRVQVHDGGNGYSSKGCRTIERWTIERWTVER